VKPTPVKAAPIRAAAVRAAVAFGRFWWEFLVGDTPELFVAVLVLVGVAFALRSHRVVAVIVLPVLAVVFLSASVYRGRVRRSRRRGRLENP